MGKPTISSELHLSLSTIGQLTSNVKSRKVDTACTVVASFSFMLNNFIRIHDQLKHPQIFGADAAAQFLRMMRRYLESFCSDLRSHTITSVQSNNDRVSLLVKDSFIDSFPNRDKPFIKLFVDT